MCVLYLMGSSVLWMLKSSSRIPQIVNLHHEACLFWNILFINNSHMLIKLFTQMYLSRKGSILFWEILIRGGMKIENKSLFLALNFKIEWYNLFSHMFLSILFLASCLPLSDRLSTWYVKNRKNRQNRCSILVSVWCFVDHRLSLLFFCPLYFLSCDIRLRISPLIYSTISYGKMFDWILCSR